MSVHEAQEHLRVTTIHCGLSHAIKLHISA